MSPMSMLDLGRLIAAHEEAFRRHNLLKTALDIAKFLSWELDKGNMHPAWVLEKKEELFYDFCALCFQTQVPLPPIPRKRGKKPILPDFSKRQIDSSKDEVGPSTLKTLLIVDDFPVDILTTAKRLAGWPNLDINYLLYQRPSSWDPTSEQVRQALEKHANIILEEHADIVLMDQGLGYNGQDGSRLIQLIREMEDRGIVFVANTGGNPADLYAEGALENCCKGKCLRGIRAAIRIVS